MKRLSLIILPLLLIVGCSKPINEETLIEKDGLLTRYYENGQKSFEGTYKNGKFISGKYWNEDGSVKE